MIFVFEHDISCLEEISRLEGFPTGRLTNKSSRRFGRLIISRLEGLPAGRLSRRLIIKSSI